MHLDYRFFVIFKTSNQWKHSLKKIAIEATNGEEYNLFEISRVFNNSNLMNQLFDPIGDIFDTVTAVEDKAFCYIHDHLKSESFFNRLTDYLFTEIIEVTDEAIMIADLTDYDTDMMGDHITYYLGGGKHAIKKCIVEGSEGLSHHDIDISDLSKMLKHETLTQAEQQRIKEYQNEKISI